MRSETTRTTAFEHLRTDIGFGTEKWYSPALCGGHRVLSEENTMKKGVVVVAFVLAFIGTSTCLPTNLRNHAEMADMTAVLLPHGTYTNIAWYQVGDVLKSFCIKQNVISIHFVYCFKSRREKRVGLDGPWLTMKFTLQFALFVIPFS